MVSLLLSKGHTWHMLYVLLYDMPALSFCLVKIFIDFAARSNLCFYMCLSFINALQFYDKKFLWLTHLFWMSLLTTENNSSQFRQLENIFDIWLDIVHLAWLQMWDTTSGMMLTLIVNKCINTQYAHCFHDVGHHACCISKTEKGFLLFLLSYKPVGTVLFLSYFSLFFCQ